MDEVLRDFLDRGICSDEPQALNAEYIRQNPVREGLIVDASKWAYVLEN